MNEPAPDPPTAPAAARRPARRPLWRRVLAFFDPAEPGFLRRGALLGCGGAVALGLVACGAALALGQFPLPRYYLAALLLESERYGLAERLANDLVRDYPRQSLAFYQLQAAVYRRTGRYEAQQAVLDALVANMPENWESYSDRCWYGSLFGDPARVLDSCDRAVAMAPPTRGFPHARRAFARIQLGDMAGAEADLTEALRRWDRYRRGPRWMVESRRRWLADIQAGRNPLDEATLAFERNRF
jgi:tetratricopeptide (TPR) repeat protein